MSARGLVIIPAYNEAGTIVSVLQGLRCAVPDLDRLIVNDGSRDATERLVTYLGERLGYGRALQAGIRHALLRGYDFVVFFDADGQYNPDARHVYGFPHRGCRAIMYDGLQHR